MKLQVVIHQSPLTQVYSGDPEVVETIDITACVDLIHSLYVMSCQVSARPNNFDSNTVIFATFIKQIVSSLAPQLDEIRCRMK